MPRIVFMGSPEFAVPILRRLSDQFQVVGVITQPDRPAGRGRKLKSPPIKFVADELKLPLIQPQKLSEPETMQCLHEWHPDLIVIAAFGQILRTEVLDLPKYGCINVHASLLPRWRGAAPIQAAILAGDEQTGITIMRMDPGIDTGPILNQVSIPITTKDSAGTLSTKLSEVGANLLIGTLPDYLEGRLIPEPQDGALATYAPMIKKEAALLDFSQPAVDLQRKVMAFNPWPGAYTYWSGQVLKIHRAHPVEVQFQQAGRRMVYQQLPALTTSKDILVIDELQPAGKNKLDGKTFLRGARGWEE